MNKMDVLTFISSIVSSTTWPLVWVGALYMFHKPLLELIPQLQRLKFRDMEAHFQGLPVSEQSLIFLDGVARKHQWTLYKTTRPGERDLGQAFSLLITDLLRDTDKKEQLVKKLRYWLDSREENLIWFASEIIGYFKVCELKDVLPSLCPQDKDEPWLSHQLNCFWAYARCCGMQYMHDFVLATTNESNQRWLLFVYAQMLDDNQSEISECINVLNRFKSREGISPTAVSEANQIIDKFKQRCQN